MRSMGGGSGYDFQICAGCGKRVITSRRDGTIGHVLGPRENWFDALEAAGAPKTIF